MNKKNYFISDLHINNKNKKLFLIFIQKYIKKINNLYILGDLFEYWLCKHQISKFNNHIILLLQELNKNGIKIFILKGNRDFLIQQKTKNLKNLIILNNLLLKIKIKKIFLSHGDKLYISEKIHFLYTKIINLKLIKHLINILPFKIKKKLMTIIKKNSRKKYEIKKEIINQKKIKKKMKEEKIKYIIHGHTHKPENYFLKLKGKIHKKFTLENWQNKTYIVSICKKEIIKFITFKKKKIHYKYKF